MIQLALYDALAGVAVRDLGDDAVRIELSIDHNSDHIAEALAEAGMHQHINEAVELFSDDSIARNYDRQSDHVVITAK